MPNTTDIAPDKHFQLGITFFHKEDYAAAAQEFSKANDIDPSNQTYSEMLELANANMVAEVNVSAPEIRYFDKEGLLSSPVVQPGNICSSAALLPPIYLIASCQFVVIFAIELLLL